MHIAETIWYLVINLYVIAPSFKIGFYICSWQEL